MDPSPTTTETTTTTTTETTTTTRSSGIRVVQMLKWTILPLFLILTAIIAIAWLILNPCEPGFGVSSLSVSNVSATNSELREMYLVHLNITNPNKKINVRVDDFKFFVCYDDRKVEVPVPDGKVKQQPCIYVDKMGEKDMKVELSLEDTPLTKLARNNGVVKFNFEMKARVTYEDGLWPTREKFLDVFCDVRFLLMKDNTAKLLGAEKQCHVVVTAS